MTVPDADLLQKSRARNDTWRKKLLSDKPPSNRPNYSLLSKAWNIGVAVILLVLAGHWLDTKFHTLPVFTLGGAVLGILYSLYEAWGH